MLLLALVVTAAPLQCPAGTTYKKEFTEESCLDADGKTTGPDELRDEDGRLLQRHLYDHGRLEASTTLFADGSPRTTRTWHHGVREGTWDDYYQPKKLAWRREYSADKLVKETIFDVDGHPLKPLKALPDGGAPAGAGLPAGMLQVVIASHQSEVKYCYEKELQHDGKLQGAVTVSFTIGAEGTVSDAAAEENTVPNPEVADCMLKRIRRWEFPRLQGGGTLDVSFPWIFKPGASD